MYDIDCVSYRLVLVVVLSDCALCAWIRGTCTSSNKCNCCSHINITYRYKRAHAKYPTDTMAFYFSIGTECQLKPNKQPACNIALLFISAYHYKSTINSISPWRIPPESFLIDTQKHHVLCVCMCECELCIIESIHGSLPLLTKCTHEKASSVVCNRIYRFSYVCLVSIWIMYLAFAELIRARERASVFDTCERLCSFTHVQFPFVSFFRLFLFVFSDFGLKSK